jgi:hypothetical protein
MLKNNSKVWLMLSAAKKKKKTKQILIDLKFETKTFLGAKKRVG